MKPDELETEALSVEVRVLWDDSVLQVLHLTPPRSFYLGEAQGSRGRQAPLVLANSKSVRVVILPGATGTIEVDGESMSIVDAISNGSAQPRAEQDGTYEVALPLGSKARVILEAGLAFEVSTVHAGRVVAGLMAFEARPIAAILLSAIFHAIALAAMVFTPRSLPTENGEMGVYTRYRLMKLNEEAAEKQRADWKMMLEQERRLPPGDYGSMGRPTRRTYGFPRDHRDPVTLRRDNFLDAMDFRVVGLWELELPISPWGNALGDPPLHRGADPIEQFLHASGATAPELVGLVFLSPSDLFAEHRALGGRGFAGGRSLGDWRDTSQRSVRDRAPEVRGRLPREVIHRALRRRIGQVRRCYGDGLRFNPSLQGTVSVSFVIGATGEITHVSAGGSLPDGQTASCAAKAFEGLSFPAPEGGVVQVTYPIQLVPYG